VLVIEDNSDVAYYIGQLLEAEHCKIYYAKDGEEGLAKANSIIPDIILTDLMMPVTDGMELCRQVRASELLNHIPIIVITAKAEEKDRLQSLEAGADAYLVKPFSAAELQLRIRKLMEQRQLLREKFSQNISEGKGPESVEHLSPNDRDFILRVRENIHNLMLKGQVDAETLASHMFVSRTQLNRKIQAISGQTTSAIILQVRISHAKRLLQTNLNMPVGEVAQKCGYDDIGHFSRVFKQVTGLSPTQFRKTLP